MNQQKRNFAYFEPFIISIFWLILFTTPVFLANDNYGFNWNHVLITWKSFIPYLGLSLLNRYILLPFFFFKNKRTWFVIINLVLIIILAYFGEVGRENRNNQNGLNQTELNQDMDRQGPSGRKMHMPPMHPPGIDQNMLPHQQRPPRQLPPYLSFALISILIIGFDTGLKLTVKWLELEQNRVKTEKESMENQLAFLKNQVSPHFFMNTLNNIHSLIDIDTEEAKDAVIRLSKLMRHLLYDSEAEQIPVHKEIEFIKSYVDLMRLRFTDKVSIQVNIPDILPDCNIPPLIFTSYLENAFKHGVSYQESSYIHINLYFSEEHLFFIIENSNPEKTVKDEASGIGMENSRKRLNLLYKDNYELIIHDTKEKFSINLKLPL